MAKRTCDVPQCGRDHYARGWCRLHYARWREHGSIDKPVRRRPTAPPCTVDDCSQPAALQELCPAHWHEERARHIATRRRPKRRPAAVAPSVAEPKVGKSCSHSGCANRPVAKGLCSWHYQVVRDTRQPGCSVEGCESPERAKGLCPNHYAYKRRHGVVSPQFTCESCKQSFPGRATTRHCVACKPTPNFYAQERKARLTLNNATMTATDHEEAAAYREIIAHDPCVYCGAASVAIDHIAPIVAGGSDVWTNLAPVCKSCNSTKRSRSMLAMLVAGASI